MDGQEMEEREGEGRGKGEGGKGRGRVKGQGGVSPPNKNPGYGPAEIHAFRCDSCQKKPFYCSALMQLLEKSAAQPTSKLWCNCYSQ